MAQNLLAWERIMRCLENEKGWYVKLAHTFAAKVTNLQQLYCAANQIRKIEIPSLAPLTSNGKKALWIIQLKRGRYQLMYNSIQ